LDRAEIVSTARLTVYLETLPGQRLSQKPSIGIQNCARQQFGTDCDNFCLGPDP